MSAFLCGGRKTLTSWIWKEGRGVKIGEIVWKEVVGSSRGLAVLLGANVAAWTMLCMVRGGVTYPNAHR